MAVQAPVIDHGHSAAQRRELQQMLDERRRQISGELQTRMARIREVGSNPEPTGDMDPAEVSDLDVVLVDIGTATLRLIDQARQRLDEGVYGMCVRCGDPIATARLRAMPFAVRCQHCETTREREQAASREVGRKHAEGRFQQ